MRSFLLAAAVAGLALAGPAHAQSQQGGYLGLNHGAQLQSARLPSGAAAGAGLLDSPTAWCASSPEPSRCRAKSAVDHDVCLKSASTTQRYVTCRFALDQMNGK